MAHRALILAALLNRPTEITGFSGARDNQATLEALRALGVAIEEDSLRHIVRVEGVGLNGLRPAHTVLELGNSGTSMRLLAGVLSAQPFSTILSGDASLCTRPMRRIIEPLRKMGADITAWGEASALKPDEYAPLSIQACSKLEAISYTLPVASAQLKSCLLLAALFAKGTMEIHEPYPTRDHTERLLSFFSYAIERRSNVITLEGLQNLEENKDTLGIPLPGDFSSAAFFLVGASLARNAQLTLKNIGLNPRRCGLIAVLKRMGAQIHEERTVCIANEPRGDLTVCSAPRLSAISLEKEAVPDLIDEIPILAIAMACAKGRSRICGVGELRFKESNRLLAIIQGLKTLSIDAYSDGDDLVVVGGEMQGGRIDSFGDHRIAMAFSIASLVSQGSLFIERCENVATSFPNFVKLAHTVGISIELRGDGWIQYL